jgi:hypothetical protein
MKSLDISITKVEPPPPPEPKPSNLYRILNDWETDAWNFTSRTNSPGWNGNDMTPETIKLHGDDPVTHFPDAAAKLVEKLDTPHGTFGYITRESAGWSNRGQTWPEKMEPIAFCNNLVEVVRIDGNKAYIRLWNGETDDPCVIHQWTNIDKSNNLYGCQNPGGDGIGYIILAYPGEYWVELDRLVKVEN